MSEEKDNMARYQRVVEEVDRTGQLLWQIYGTFLLPQTIFLSFLLQTTLGDFRALYFRPGPFFTALVGAFLCIPWAACFFRSSEYYIFRMAQAREAEPSGWNIINGDGEKFAEGKGVQAGGKQHRIGYLSRKLRTKSSAPLLITIFAAVYIVIAAISGPWWSR